MGTKLFNKELARMGYIRGLQNHIMDALYKDAERSLEKAMWLIAEENQAILPAKTPTFVFDGRWWPVPKPNNPTECNRVLHPDLYDRVQELLDQTSFKDHGLKAGIKTLLGNLLTAAGHVDDLARLLPETLQATMPTIDEDVFNIRKPLSDLEVKDLLAVNADNLQYLKRLLMTQLLLAKT